MDNLIGNAIKYTPGKGPIEVKLKKKEDHTAEITIKDEGIGMTRERNARNFQAV